MPLLLITWRPTILHAQPNSISIDHPTMLMAPCLTEDLLGKNLAYDRILPPALTILTWPWILLMLLLTRWLKKVARAQRLLVVACLWVSADGGNHR